MDFTKQHRSQSFLLKNKRGEKNNDNIDQTKYQCTICKLDYQQMISDPGVQSAAPRSPNAQLLPEDTMKLYTVSENIFGLSCPSSKLDHKSQQENIYNALCKIKEYFPVSDIKLFCLTETCPDVSQLCNATANFLVDFSKPPKLKSMLIFCENIFDWLAKADDNKILIYFQGSISAIVLMVYAYSYYYDALPRRDIQLSLAMKSFINTNIKQLEKIPISYRRYSGYMSLYSCMNQLQSLRSSVYLYCIILYSFPLMESDKEKCSQLFFKIYTDDPLICCHTTKLYCLPATVNRLVILFEKFPISLHNDTMVICYHRRTSACRRTKLFRLNFHTCQAISDMLTFHCQDFEEVYAACPMKMKVDFYFRQTAVFAQGECEYVIEAGHSDLSTIERTDSYTVLGDEKHSCNLDNNIVLSNKETLPLDTTDHTTPKESVHSDSTSITVYKTNVTDYREKDVRISSPTSSENIINQSGRISGPIDSHHSTKLDSVRTSSSVLNGTGYCGYDYKSTSLNYGNNAHQNRAAISIDREKCNQQLDTLMKDLNLENAICVNPSKTNSNGYTKFSQNHDDVSTQKSSSTTNNREIQLMTELLEAQKEISNLRRSMNHLDITDQSARITNAQNPNNNFLPSSRFNKMTRSSVSSSTPDTYHYSTSRNQNWAKNDAESLPLSTNQAKPRLNTANESIFNVKTDSANEFLDGRQPGYSAHRENLERDRVAREKYVTAEQAGNQTHQNEKETTDVFEEIETINLQPIGKGIQDLAKGNSQNKLAATSHSKFDSTSNFFPDNMGSLSPMSMRKNIILNKIEASSISRLNSEVGSQLFTNVGAYHGRQPNITLQNVEDKIQIWYMPQISRDEAIAILRHCSPGNFLIRDSNTYSGAYGLAIKVASIPHNVTLKSDDLEAEKVRHYLIELVGTQGVCFKGFPEEPIFPSLSHLVLYYTHASSVLPCLLTLPEKPLTVTDILRSNKTSASNQSINISSPRISSNRRNNLVASEFSVYYLGCYDVEYITGPSVINKAVERLMEYIDARRFTECQLRINPGEGIVLTDLERKLFFRRNHPFSTISYCAADPRNRKIELDLCKSKGVKKTKIFGIIVKSYIAGENKCFLFGELDPAQKACVIVKIINEHIQKSVDPIQGVASVI